MKEFLQILRRFVPPYKKYLGLSVLFNILSAVLNIFSFCSLDTNPADPLPGRWRYPCQRLYEMGRHDWGSIKESAQPTTCTHYIQEFIVAHSASAGSAWLSACSLPSSRHSSRREPTFLSSATMVPSVPVSFTMSATQLYQKVTFLLTGLLQRGAQGRYHHPNER